MHGFLIKYASRRTPPESVRILFEPAARPMKSTYPIGFVSISEYLGRAGFEVRIINIALKMLKSNRYNVEKEIKALNPIIFGIDLHWMPHVHGSLAIAEIVKKYHPNIQSLIYLH